MTPAEAVNAFLASRGDTTPLLASADWLDDQYGRGTDTVTSRFFRKLSETPNDAVLWFQSHATVVFPRTTREGLATADRLRQSATHAWWEAVYMRRIAAGEWQFDWQPDADGDHLGPPPAWSCDLHKIVGGNSIEGVGVSPIAMLDNIDLGHELPPGWTDNKPADYCRIVQAFLASGVDPKHLREDERLPAWLATPLTFDPATPE